MIMEGITALRRPANNFAMTLYSVFKHEIGLKSAIVDAFGIFGIKTRLVAFHCFRICPELKNSLTASVTSAPMTDQLPQKNSEEKPSGPQALFLGREKKASLISREEKGASR